MPALLVNEDNLNGAHSGHPYSGSEVPALLYSLAFGVSLLCFFFVYLFRLHVPIHMYPGQHSFMSSSLDFP